MKLRATLCKTRSGGAFDCLSGVVERVAARPAVETHGRVAQVHFEGLKLTSKLSLASVPTPQLSQDETMAPNDWVE